MSRFARTLRVGLVVATLGVLGVLVMPGRLWFGQRHDIAEAQEQLATLREEQTDLRKRVNALKAPELIERQAKVGFGMVFPGDEMYTVTPAPPLEVDLPDVWPFNRVQDALADVAADA